MAGDFAHQQEDYEGSVRHMEEALVLYWEALEDCKAMCEEPFDMGWFPDFVSSVASKGVTLEKWDRLKILLNRFGISLTLLILEQSIHPFRPKEGHSWRYGCKA